MKLKHHFCVVALLLLSVGGHSQTEPIKLPDTPQGRIIGAFVKAINSGDAQVFRDFHAQHYSPTAPKPADLDGLFRQLANLFGGIEAAGVQEASEQTVAALVQSKKGAWFRLEFTFEGGAEVKLRRVGVQSGQPPPGSTGGGHTAGGTGNAISSLPLVMTATAGSLFENVATVLQKKYYDEGFRANELPKLVAQYAERAKRAATLRQQREVVQEMLSRIPATHLGLLSQQSFRYVTDDLLGRAYPTFGFQLLQQGGKYYAFAVLEGGPAARGLAGQGSHRCAGRRAGRTSRSRGLAHG